MSRMFGAPFGGTTLGGHQGLESLAVSLITPPNFDSAGGSCLPLMVVVASGVPDGAFSAAAARPASAMKAAHGRASDLSNFAFMLFLSRLVNHFFSLFSCCLDLAPSGSLCQWWQPFVAAFRLPRKFACFKSSAKKGGKDRA